MQYIIMDLEWNNTYAKKADGYINEIIEIGAVKLDDELETVDTFSCIIRSQIGKKLRGSVKRLTHLTNDDISTGVPFTKAFSVFRKWVGTSETVVLTWGDGDIRVLIDNYKYLNGIRTIPFLSYYCDLQNIIRPSSNATAASRRVFSPRRRTSTLTPRSIFITVPSATVCLPPIYSRRCMTSRSLPQTSLSATTISIQSCCIRQRL